MLWTTHCLTLEGIWAFSRSQRTSHGLHCYTLVAFQNGIYIDQGGETVQNVRKLGMCWRHEHITLFFMVAGHTRCLVGFGLLKQKYRRSDCFTMDALAEVIDSSAAHATLPKPSISLTLGWRGGNGTQSFLTTLSLLLASGSSIIFT